MGQRAAPRGLWVAAGAVAVLAGVAVGVQSAPSASAPAPDLVRQLSSLAARADALRDEVAALEEEVASLRAERDEGSGALAEAERRLDALRVLAAVVPAEGAGLVLTVDDPSGAVTYGVLLDVVQELRDAGAEAVAVNGRRFGPVSALGPSTGAVVLDGEVLRPPYVVEAVGDPHALDRGVGIPGGARDSLEALADVAVAVTRHDHLRLPAAATDQPTGRVR